MVLYPIGTIVRVGVSSDLLMIVSRYPLSIKDNVKGYFEYSACLYPIGVEVNNNAYLFNHEDIVEVIFEGYVNKLEEKLRSIYDREIPKKDYKRLSV